MINLECMFLVDYCMSNFSVFVLYICLCLPVYLYFYISASWRIMVLIIKA